MAGATAKKLNINCLSVPCAFLGKARDKKYGSESFKSENGGRRLTCSDIFTLALMHTESVMFGSLNLMTYSAFTDELHYSRPTVCSSLKKLTGEGAINKLRQSKYEIKSAFSDKKTVTVYKFLIEEELDLGGTVRRLTKNEALYASIVIASYLNPKNKGKHFVGGISRVASALNVPTSTAWYVINRLIATKVLFRKSMIKDSAGNEVITNGKGNSSKELTVYEVNSEILKRCKAIEKERQELRAVKALYEQNVKKADKAKQPKEQPGKHSERFTLARSDNDFKPDFTKVINAFKSDGTYLSLSKSYNNRFNKFVSAVRAGKLTDELEEDIETALDSVREYLIKRGIPPEGIPDNLSEYIKE